jgi:quinohemoprotein ethanol dehydrogenase
MRPTHPRTQWRMRLASQAVSLRRRRHVAFALVLLLAGCGQQRGTTQAAGGPTGPVQRSTGERIANADAEPHNWLSHGRNYEETRHSPLAQITTANVARLGLAWSFDLDTDRGQESTPLVVDGVMYTTSAWSKVQAFDAVSGTLLWQFDPKMPGAVVVRACCDMINRGAAYWEGKIYVGVLDGRLIALDARSGKPLWSTLTVDPEKPYSITGAPRVVKGKVIIGNSGGEYAVRGYVSAYDADTGQLVWRFYTVPGAPGRPDGAASDAVLARIAAPTWAPDSWTRTRGGGGGTVWDSMAFDPQLDLLYIGVGNGSYHPLELRGRNPAGNNDNLFLGSVLALRPDTGEYVWHYQETPEDSWDYTSTQHMILAELPIRGVSRKVLLHAPKNGFFYVLDRATGAVLSAQPYTRVTWANGIDRKTGRPIIDPDADYGRTGKPWIGSPDNLGGHNWHPMAFNPDTGLVYIPARETTGKWSIDTKFRPLPLGINVGLDMESIQLPDDAEELAALRKREKGFLLAWDPINQREAWRVPHSTSWNGGVLSTAGRLVFQGDIDGKFTAYDASNGRELWSFDAQSAITAAPITWSKDGTQYVTVVAGWGTSYALGYGPLSWTDKGPRRNKSRVLTFVLDGKAVLPPMTLPTVNHPAAPAQFADVDTIETGRILYQRTCFTCHGLGGMSAGVIADLRYSQALGSKDAWRAIVADGALSERGMVGFSENFTPDEIEALRAYIIERAQETAP